MTVLVTGGAWYIASHTVLALPVAGADVDVLDNSSHSSPESLARVENITGRSLTTVTGDVRDRAMLERLFAEHDFNAVIHFAGLKAVGESVEKPLAYYENNVYGTLTLCQAMAKAGVFQLVFSSSATVYGDPDTMPVQERMPTGKPTNPY